MSEHGAEGHNRGCVSVTHVACSFQCFPGLPTHSPEPLLESCIDPAPWTASEHSSTVHSLGTLRFLLQFQLTCDEREYSVTGQNKGNSSYGKTNF